MYSRIGKKTLQKIDILFGKSEKKCQPVVINADTRSHSVEPGSQQDLHSITEIIQNKKEYEW